MGKAWMGKAKQSRMGNENHTIPLAAGCSVGPPVHTAAMNYLNLLNQLNLSVRNTHMNISYTHSSTAQHLLIK